MSLLKILKYPDPFLRKKCAPVEEIDEELLTLLDDMTETMYAARGVGLAASQVGADKRVVVIDVSPWYRNDGGEEGEGMMSQARRRMPSARIPTSALIVTTKRNMTAPG